MKMKMKKKTKKQARKTNEKFANWLALRKGEARGLESEVLLLRKLTLAPWAMRHLTVSTCPYLRGGVFLFKKKQSKDPSANFVHQEPNGKDGFFHSFVHSFIHSFVRSFIFIFFFHFHFLSYCEATASGVMPNSLEVSGLAPRVSRNSTTRWWPSRAAIPA
jgi:hypothetical protein